VTVRDEVSVLALRLRRYARALTQASPAPSDIADELVYATLLHMHDNGSLDRTSDATLTAFTLLTQLNRDRLRERRWRAVGATRGAAVSMDRGQGKPDPAKGRSKGLLEGLADLKLEEREALLLVVLEQFSYAQASHILHVSSTGLMSRLARARASLDGLLEAPLDATGRRRGSHLRLVK
jgi:RNA polymerase sigma-70 factor, ECF subfamily